MPSVRITPDNFIVVQHKSAGLLYVDSAANFAADYGGSAPTVTPGFITSYYDMDTGRYIASDGQSEEVISFGVSVPNLDAVIASLTALVQAKAARESVAPVV